MRGRSYGFRPDGLEDLIVPYPRDEDEGWLAAGGLPDFDGLDTLPP